MGSRSDGRRTTSATPQIALKLDPELHADATDLSVLLGITVTELARRALRNEVEAALRKDAPGTVSTALRAMRAARAELAARQEPEE